MEKKLGATLGMTGSYNTNSSPQLSFIQSSIPYLQQAIQTLNIKYSSSPLIIADFGSSHGSNSLYVIKIIIDFIKELTKNEQSFLVVHNDLPTNDWSTLFNVLNQDKTYFGLANGRSFYEQCLPSNSLTVGYTATSLHWLSQKPCNISNHCVSLYAEGEELDAFKRQARDDYRHFLENRSRELIQGGVLILIITCVNDQGQSMVEGIYNLLYKCAQLLPLTKQELLTYTLPTHLRSYQECLDQQLFDQYSLQLMKSGISRIDLKFHEQWQKGDITLDQFAKIQVGIMRSGTESILKQTLETTEKRSKEEIDQLNNRFWDIYYEQVKENPDDLQLSSYQTYVVLKKL